MTATDPCFPGVYLAKVFSVADPNQSGQVQLVIPQIYGARPIQIWAPPLIPSAVLPNQGDVVWCMFQGGDPAYPTYLPNAMIPTIPSVPIVLPAGRSELGAVNAVSSSGGFIEIHSNMRCAVTTGPSGVAEVMISIQGVYTTVAGATDISIGTSVDGGAWTLIGGHPFTAVSVLMNIFCHHVYTGLTPGPHTFWAGWANTGGGTMNLNGAGRGPCAHSANIVLPR